MPVLILPGPLQRLTSEFEQGESRGRPVQINAANWAELVELIRARHPSLAAHVINGDNTVREGILLVVNGDVVSGGSYAERLSATDRVSFIAQISGG